MKVKEVLDLLAYGTKWQLIGASSGKKLCNELSSQKMKDKYMDEDTTDSPIFPSFRTRKEPITNTYEYAVPMINIWVTGK